MGFDRFGAKLSARESLRNNSPSPVLVTLVYFLLTLGLSLGVLILLAGPLVAYVNYISTGYPVEEAVGYILRDHGNTLAVFGVVLLLLQLYSMFMSFGYTSYSLRMARNEQPRFNHLFDGFARPLRVLGANLLVGLFTLLWTLAVLLPMSALLVLGDVAFSDGYYIISNVATITTTVVAYRYSLTFYVLIDDPACTIRQAIRRSKEVMRGRKWSLFILDLSFLGWELLAVLLGFLSSLVVLYAGVFLLRRISLLAAILGALVGILAVGIWLNPYWSAARANFYDSVTGTVQPGGDPAGPGYDYRAGEGPEPF